MENTVKPSLAVGEDVPGKSSELADGHTMPSNGAPAPPLGANMKESPRPTLATAIAELVRLRQLAEAVGRELPPYNENGPPAQRR
jgi:hypothetical protein